MNFQTYADKLNEQLQQERRQAEQERKRELLRQTEKAWQELIADTGIVEQGIDIRPGAVIVYPGITLKFYPVTLAANKHWRVMGICPFCGKAVESRDCRNLEQIAEHLAEFTPHFTHICRKEVPEQTAGECLLEAFREWLQEILSNS